jgi:tetratricopeptide (TPR) repeat protein
MLESAPLNVLVLLAAVVVQGAVYVGFGDLLCRWLAGFRLVAARLPEVAFLFGFAGCALCGYAVLVISTSAAAVPVGVLLAALGIWIYAAQRVTSSELPPFLHRYREVRASKAFRIAIAMAILFAAAVGAYRMLWMLDLNTSRGVLFGANLWDDMRTIGFPVSIAAHGYPMRSPIAMETQLLYPLGIFVMAAGQIAWLPDIALPILIADTTWQAAFYAVTVLIVCGVLVETTGARLLLAATALLASSYNLWSLGPDTNWSWWNTYFGYYRHNSFYTTIGFRPYAGVLWISNHVVGFASLLVAAVWFAHRRHQRDWVVAVVFAAFTAATSVDMAAMGAVAASIALAPRFLGPLLKRHSVPPDVWRGIAVCAAATALVVLINLPALTGKVDSPYDILFPRLISPTYNVGMFTSHNLFYLLLLIIGTVMLRSFAAFRTLWAIPAVTGIAFSFLFEFHSIWFWRFTVASHLLFGLLCARQLDLLRSRAYAVVWLLTLVPGVVQLAEDVRPRFNSWTTPERVSAIRWLYGNTALNARVAEFREDEDSVVPDATLLRTGNRGGFRVYDRSHALIGYRIYADRMTALDAAVAYNDFVLISRKASEVDRFLTACGAPRPFENSAFRIYAIDNSCRSRMSSEDLQQPLRAYQRRVRIRSALGVNSDPYKLPMDLYQLYVIQHPEHISGFRRRLEYLWGASMWSSAAKWVEPVVAAHPKSAEANYSYAFSLHCGNIDLRKAIAHYDAAEAAGYPPFWTAYNRGAAYFLLKDYARARADLERAHSLDANHAQVRELLDKLSKAGK